MKTDSNLTLHTRVELFNVLGALVVTDLYITLSVSAWPVHSLVKCCEQSRQHPRHKGKRVDPATAQGAAQLEEKGLQPALFTGLHKLTRGQHLWLSQKSVRSPHIQSHYHSNEEILFKHSTVTNCALNFNTAHKSGEVINANKRKVNYMYQLHIPLFLVNYISKIMKPQLPQEFCCALLIQINLVKSQYIPPYICVSIFSLLFLLEQTRG